MWRRRLADDDDQSKDGATNLVPASEAAPFRVPWRCDEKKKKKSLAALRQNATTERREVTVPVSPPMQAASEAKEENECAALERQCATWGVAVAWCFFRNRTSSASQALAARNALPRSARALERAAPFGGPWATF